MSAFRDGSKVDRVNIKLSWSQSLPEWELGWMPLQRETLDPDSMDRTTMMFGFNSKFNPPTHRFVFALVPFYCKAWE